MPIKRVRKKHKSSRTKDAKKKIKHTRREFDDNLKFVGNIVAIFIAIFVFISNISWGGEIGGIVRSVVLLLLGTSGYFLPIVLIISIIVNLTEDRNVSYAKISSIFVLYLAIISLITTINWSYNINDYVAIVEDSVKRANGGLNFTKELFSGGVIATSIVYLLRRAIGSAGALILSLMVTAAASIFTFGFSFAKNVFSMIAMIILFIPNTIKKLLIDREENDRIAEDNEKILNDVVEKSRKKNLQVTFDKSFKGDRLVLEPVSETKMHVNDSDFDISAKDVQDLFFDVNAKKQVYDRPQSHLLKEMKKKSINEIIYEEKKKGNDESEFFYTEGMRPIDDLENIVLPEPRIESNNNKETIKNIYDDLDTDSIYNSDTNSFARGLDDLKNDDVIDKTSVSNTRTNIEREGIELKNTFINNNDFEISIKKRHKKYRFPPLNLLNKNDRRAIEKDPHLNEKAKLLVDTLKTFGVGTTLLNITVGPAVTRYELKPDVGVKVSKILSLENDVQLALAASSLKIEAPIPGKAAIGIEISNEKSANVLLGDILSSSEFRNAESKLTVAIGKDISGKNIVTDLRKMPHLLIAGATGSGKSVCVNSLITSLIYKSSPEDVRLIMVDPKVVELQIYDGIPHLLVPVVTNPKKAASALSWAVAEMTRRYNLIQEKRVRDIESYNQTILSENNNMATANNTDSAAEEVKKLPYIVIIIDEFADLMMVASKDVENSIMRIAQLARACGIYLVIATQRPSVNVISGSIKTNVPSRISFAVSSGIDSQTILDRRGAEKLLGHGDMLYFPQGIPEPIRVQGCYISEEEIINIVNYVKDDDMIYDDNAQNMIEKGITPSNDDTSQTGDNGGKDERFVDAGRLIIEEGNASIGMIQRKFAMGFNRAARIIDQLEGENVISKQDGKKPREVLMSIEEFNSRFGG